MTILKTNIVQVMFPIQLEEFWNLIIRQLKNIYMNGNKSPQFLIWLHSDFLHTEIISIFYYSLSKLLSDRLP